MEKIAEFDKKVIATVCGSFRRGIGNGLLLSDDCNNPKADPGGCIGWLTSTLLQQPIQFSSFSSNKIRLICFFFISHSLALSLFSTSVSTVKFSRKKNWSLTAVSSSSHVLV